MTKQAAAENAYEHVKHRILNGAFTESSMLSEGEVASSLGVSRTPVREAFLRLEAEGFLKLYPKRGALVTPISRQDIREVYEARTLIDMHAAGRICALGEPARAFIADQLDALIEQQLAAVKAGDLARYSSLDADFHQLVMNSGDNDILADLGHRLRERQQRFTATAISRNADRARIFIEGHKQLSAALRDGDIDEYCKQFAAHIADSRSQL